MPANKKPVDDAQQPPPTTENFANLLNEMIIHGGQAAYVRGLLQGPNWSNI